MSDIAAITPLKAFADNYIWVLHDDRHAVVVDPGQSEVVLAFLAEKQLTLSAIWLTHGHHDHVGGIAALRESAPTCPVYGPASLAEVTEPVMEGSELASPLGPCRVYETPGHTANHLVYHCGQHLFCGDTLFAAGCGRLFDGTAAQLMHSLQRLAALPPDTLIYPAHEYTLSNLRFAAAVEPDNAMIRQRQQDCETLRAADRPTVPSLLSLELLSNPFLRHQLAAVSQQVQRHTGCTDDALGVFSALREWKNRF